MYYRSLLVFALCSIFVGGVVVALAYDTSGVGTQSQTVVIGRTTCSSSLPTCEFISITSAGLRTVNYTDELGTVSYARLTLTVGVSGPYQLTRVELFVGNSSAGYAQGPFQPGANRVVNTTLPATISITPGRTYIVGVEGFYNGGTAVWASLKVTAT